MPRPCPIALTGLTSTEQVLLGAALFQSAGNQLPGAVLENDLSKALLIIANADDANAVRTLRAQLPAARVLLVGASDQGTGWPVVPRPMRLHAVLEAARRALSPVLERRVSEPEFEPSGPPSRAGGWLRRLAGGRESTGFLATQPFMSRDLQQTDFEQTRQHEPGMEKRFHEATQPMMAVQPEAQAVAQRKGFESTVAFSVHSPVQPDFEATQQTERDLPSVLPSNWEAEVAEWEAELAERSARVAASAAADARSGSDRAGSDTMPQSLLSPAASAADRPQLESELRSAKDNIPKVAMGERPSGRKLDGFAAATDTWTDPPCRVLVVGAPGQATGGLLKTLNSARFIADYAGSADAALSALAAKPYQAVFLIEFSLGEGAITLCRAIRARSRSPGPDPRIAIVASHRRLLARIRASFAGCNAWMTIPLDREALVRYIQQTAIRPGL